MNLRIVMVIAALAVLLLLSQLCFTVGESDYAVRTHFGAIVRSDYAPGLHLKSPFDRVSRIDRRLLTRAVPAEPMLSSDGKALNVDFYFKWRVLDPVRYLQAVGGDDDTAGLRLGDIVKAALKAAVAARSLPQIAASTRADLSDEAIARLNRAAAELGTTLADVALQRVDLADDLAAAVSQRMQESYLAQARQLRAMGAAEADNIRTEAERKRVELTANATRDAQRIRGEGEAAAAAIYARAYGRNAEFAAFYRSMQAYRNVLGREGDILVLSPDGEFFKYLHNPGR
jgi:membrane protease subunit HflC